MQDVRPSVSRETKGLLVVVLVSISILWVLARIRFPDRPPTPNPVTPVLAQLAPPSAFDDMEETVARVSAQLDSALIPLEARLAPAGAAAAVLAALRFRDDLAVTSVGEGAGPAATAFVAGTEVGRDLPSGVAVVRVPTAHASVPPVWEPRRVELPRFLIAADVSREGTALRPVFAGALFPVASPLWPGSIWALPRATDMAAGTFVFTSDGAFAGLVVRHDGGTAIVPGGTVLAMADRLASQGVRSPGRIGIEVQPLMPAVAAATGATAGVVVAWVDPQGPAAGLLRATDVVEKVDGAAIDSLQHWDARAGRVAAGDVLTLAVRRGTVTVDVQVTAAPAVPAPGNPDIGLVLRTVRRVGAEVVRVNPDTAGARAGLRAGDVITIAGEIEAPTPAQVSRLYATRSDERPLILAFTRGDSHHVTTLEKRP